MKRCTMILSTILLILALCACEVTSSFSYSFDVATGDRIKVELDTSTGLDLSQKDGRFFVKEGEDKIVEGLFITRETYEERMAMEGSPEITTVEQSEKDGNSYWMYEVDGQAGLETDCLLWVEGSDTGIRMGSLAGREKAQNAFAHLTFSVDGED